MIPLAAFLAGGIFAFKFLYEHGVLSGKTSAKPGTPKKAASAPAPSAAKGVGEDYFEPIKAPPKKAAETVKKAPPAPAKAGKASEAPKEEKKLPLPSRKGKKGSYDDVIDEKTGVGVEEFPELHGQDDYTEPEDNED